MNDSPTCSKCQTEMEAGYIMDLGHGNVRRPVSWVEGEPERSIWMGTKIAGKQKLEVHSFRCPKCGYLESYTR